MQSNLYDLIEDILEDWAVAVEDGQPNPKNLTHILQLEEVLLERKYNRKAIKELIRRLMEKDLVRKGEGSPYLVKKFNPARGQKLVKKDASDKDVDTLDTDEKDSTTEPKDKPEETTTDKVSNDNKSDRNKRYERGHNKGAPGNAGSMLNEEGSNDVAEQMIKNPDMTEEEALDYLLKNIEGTKLEEQNQSEVLAGDIKVGDLPPDTPKEKRGIVSKAILAVRNGRRKAQKARQHIDKHGWDEKNCKNLNFGGEAADKKKQIEFLKDKKVYAFKNGKRVQVPPEKVEDFINSAGKKKNPSDTSSIIYDEKSGEATILFHSDKDSPVAQTGNSTQMEELTGEVTQENLTQLVEEEIITQEQADEILFEMWLNDEIQLEDETLDEIADLYEQFENNEITEKQLEEGMLSKLRKVGSAVKKVGSVAGKVAGKTAMVAGKVAAKGAKVAGKAAAKGVKAGAKRLTTQGKIDAGKKKIAKHKKKEAQKKELAKTKKTLGGIQKKKEAAKKKKI